MFGELIATMRARVPDPRLEPWPVQVILDEFDQLGHMPIIVQSLKQLAGHGARVSIITQSVPGLESIYTENERLSIEPAAGMKLYIVQREKDRGRSLRGAWKDHPAFHQRQLLAGQAGDFETLDFPAQRGTTFADA